MSAAFDFPWIAAGAAACGCPVAGHSLFPAEDFEPGPPPLAAFHGVKCTDGGERVVLDAPLARYYGRPAATGTGTVMAPSEFAAAAAAIDAVAPVPLPEPVSMADYMRDKMAAELAKPSPSPSMVSMLRTTIAAHTPAAAAPVIGIVGATATVAAPIAAPVDPAPAAEINGLWDQLTRRTRPGDHAMILDALVPLTPAQKVAHLRLLIESTGAAPYTAAVDPGDFPVDALPEPMRGHCEWVMDAVAVPGAMVGPMYLPVLSAACGRAVIDPRMGWVEHGPIRTVVIAPPSSRKSPTLAHVTAPLAAAQQTLRERIGQSRAAAEVEHAALESALESARKAYGDAYKRTFAGPAPAVTTPAPIVVPPKPISKSDSGGAAGVPIIGSVNGDGADLATLRDRMQALQGKVSAAKDSIPGRVLLHFGDATDAALERALDECRGTAFMLSPEAGKWFEQMARGDDKFTCERNYLQSYSGEPLVILREGRGEVVVEDPYLPMLLVIQPDALARALAPDRDGRRRLVGNGVWARMGAAYVAGSDPDDYDRPIPDGTAVAKAYSNTVQAEFMRSYGRKEPLRFGVAPDAKRLLAHIYDRVERIKVAQDALPTGVGMSTEWGKAVGRCLRIARVFTQLQVTDADIADHSRMHMIDAGTLADAWRITEWMLASAAFAMGGAKADSDDEMLAKTVAWLRKRLAKDGPVAYRTLYGNKKYKSKNESTHRPWLDDALDFMEGRGEIIVTPGVALSNATVTPTVALAAAG